MARIIPIVRPSIKSQIASACIQILTIPIPENFSIQAIAALPGMEEPWRIRLPIAEWENNPSIPYLLMSGETSPITVCDLMDHYGLRRKTGLYIQKGAKYTTEQTDWIIKIANRLKISSLLLMNSPFHLVRTYLTIVKSYLRFAKRKIVILPRPLPIPPTVILPENRKTARAMIPGEIRRILKYSHPEDKLQNVATLAELENYLDEILYPALGLSP